MGLFTIGLQYTTATNALILELCVPVWGSLAGMLFRTEKPTIFKIIGMKSSPMKFDLISSLGIIITIGGGAVMLEVEKFSLEGTTMIGNFLVLGFTIGYSFVYLSLGKSVFKHVETFPALT